MQIDCYGFEASSQWFKRKELDAHLIKTVDGVMYACFGEGSKRCIHRLDKDADGNLRMMWAYGAWDDAADLKYVPINDTMEIENEEEK